MQLLIIMVPVLFGLMGFAVDLGRLYLIRGELNQAATAMAMAAAQNLNGSAGSLELAALAANNTISQEFGDGLFLTRLGFHRREDCELDHDFPFVPYAGMCVRSLYFRELGRSQ